MRHTSASMFSPYPNIESDCASICVEYEWMDLNTESCNIFLLEFTSHVALDECSFASTSIAHQDAFECWNITFSGHSNRLIVVEFLEQWRNRNLVGIQGIWVKFLSNWEQIQWNIVKRRIPEMKSNRISRKYEMSNENKPCGFHNNL